MTHEQEHRFSTNQLISTLVSRVNSGGLLKQHEWEEFEGQLPGAVNAGEFVVALQQVASIKPEDMQPFVLAREVLHTAAQFIPEEIVPEYGGAAYALLIALIGGRIFEIARRDVELGSGQVSVASPREVRSLRSLLKSAPQPNKTDYLYANAPLKYKIVRETLRQYPFFRDEDARRILEEYTKMSSDQFDNPAQSERACRVLLDILINRAQEGSTLSTGGRRLSLPQPSEE